MAGAKPELDQQFIEYVVKNLVDHPDEVQLERSIDDRGVLLELTVHPDDMGKIIGKAGSTAKAIRTLLRVIGAKTDERLNLKIIDRDGDTEASTEAAVATEAAPAEESAAEAAPESDTEPAEATQEAPAVEEAAEVPEIAPEPTENVVAEPAEEISLTEVGATPEEADATVDADADMTAIKAKAREGLDDLDMDL